MKCPNCQNEVSEEAIFCGKCGTELSIVCPKCNAENPPDNNFCEKCGHDLKVQKEIPSIDYSEPQSYTPKHLKDKILSTRSSIEGERKLVTVFFADVANYTSISEKLDPEEVHQIMDGAFKVLLYEIHKYEGTINQFTGDGVMALFGAPVAHEDHAQRACHTALSVQKAVREYGQKIMQDTGVDFQMRIGLNSGHVIVGSIGDDLRMDYTAVGDTTNLASRMENMAEPGAVMISRNTHRLVRDFFECESLGQVDIKGKEDPQEAYRLIRAGEVETRISASVAKGLTRFVGRRNSMGALLEAFDRAKEGSGQVVGVVGEAGVGKSRLIIEMRNRIPPEEYTYLEGRCIHYGGSMAYLPILDILRIYFDIQENDREFIIKKKVREKIAELDTSLSNAIPSFQEILSLKVDDEQYLKQDPQMKRILTFEALRDLFIRESQQKLLVLAIEDLHWIDKTSEDFLDYLIGWIAKARILLILLYRPEYTHQWGSKSYYSKIGVDQLGTESSSELVVAMLEGGEVAPELREIILNRAAGNPLFMEEFTSTLLENGTIQKKDHQYVLARELTEVMVPDTIQGIIAARMDRLDDNLKRTMQVASVIGRDFAFRVLQAITGMREELKLYLLNLQGLEFIYEEALFPELQYIFKHALTQEVAYNSLLQKRRKEIHERIGQAIEEIYVDRLEEFYGMLAYHYSKSENFEKAYQYNKRSGDRAVSMYSNLDAFRFYKEAVIILKNLPDNEERKREMIGLIMLMDTPMRLLGYPDECIQYLQEGEQASKELGDERGLATFYSIMGLYYTFRADFQKSVEYAENCYQEATKMQDIDLMAPAAMELGVSYFWSGDYEKVVDLAPAIIELLEKNNKQAETFGRPYNIYTAVLGVYGFCLSHMGYIREGEALCERSLRNALEISHLASLTLAELLYGLCFFNKGETKAAIEHLQNAIRYGEEGQSLSDLAAVHIFLGWIYNEIGELKAAREHTEFALNFFRERGVPTFEAYALTVFGMIYFESGNLKSSENYFRKALVLSQDIHKFWGGYSQIWLGRVHSRKDIKESDRAEKQILEGMEVLESSNIRPYCAQGYLFLGELYADLGQEEKALENLTKAIEIFKECGADGWVEKYEKELTALS